MHEIESKDEGESEISEGCEKKPVRSNCEKKWPSKFDHYVLYTNFFQSCTSVTYKESGTKDNYKQWRKAIKREFDDLNETETWELVERCDVQEVISSKWLYMLKLGGHYKTHLVVRSFQYSGTFLMKCMYLLSS